MDNIIGKIIDDMKVIRLEYITKNFVKCYRVRCEVCGNEKIIQYARLNRHETTFHNNNKYYIQEMDKNIGITINDYTIIKRLNKKMNKEYYYLAKCNICGTEFETTMGNFKAEYGTTHDMCTHHIPHSPYLKRFRKIYSCMRYRTTNPNYTEYYLYGGRGIKSDYYSDFIVFYQEMFESYIQHCVEYGENETSIDRINVNGNYEKNNVRWVTNKEQSSNRRNSKNN